MSALYFFTCSNELLRQGTIIRIAAWMAFIILPSTTALLGQTFTDISAPLTGVSNGIVVWGDYDNDGDIDILLTGYISSFNTITRIYRNDSGNFVVGDTSLIGASSSSAWSDYDNDGDLDILLAGSNAPKLYRNDGGNFVVDTRVNLGALKAGAAAWGDYNNDGTLDLALTGYTGNPPTGNILSAVYRNVKGTFVYDFESSLRGVYGGSVAWGDYENDGDLDFLFITCMVS
jgi:hypothetical protein